VIHQRRLFSVGLIGSPEELAEKLTNHTWTLCTGFEIGDYLFLNDSFSEDGAQEFAAIKKPTDKGRPFVQVETITFSWCDQPKALDYIRRTMSGEFDDEGRLIDRLRLDKAEHHGCCPLCE
jgi:hypothetical protein